ncbi:MAG TPA: sensor histidine kinase [Microscillaceae bacterium]|nr:sensor histidine kinase [Microscillaceae bacterium]
MFVKIFQKEKILVFLFYSLMAILYYLALVIDTGFYYHYWAVLLNHFLKALITIPLWWLFFHRLAIVPIWKKMSLHLLGLPLFTLVWVWVYYLICDRYGIHRLQGSRIVWDYYITVLFYIVQFGNFHLYEYYKKLQQQQLIAAQLGQLNLQSELSALKAQLNPHFLYNVFNTINAAIPKTAKHARDMVNKLSDLFRYQLKASREELVSVKEELTFVQQYLELEKERFGARLSFEMQVDDTLLKEKIPPILIQPIVENSVKHGISPLIEGGTICLQICKTPQNTLNITISDTGTGVDRQQKSDLLKRGIGLSNTDERLQKMYGIGLALKDNTPQGLIVNFTIPLENEITLV